MKDADNVNRTRSKEVANTCWFRFNFCLFSHNFPKANFKLPFIVTILITVNTVPISISSERILRTLFFFFLRYSDLERDISFLKLCR